MDRNVSCEISLAASSTDVPRKGNVDRNVSLAGGHPVLGLTFPARGTWIEIQARYSLVSSGVRGTWIEMSI